MGVGSISFTFQLRTTKLRNSWTHVLPPLPLSCLVLPSCCLVSDLDQIEAIPLIFLHLIFVILQFEISSLMNLNFTSYSRQKNPVQTRKKMLINFYSKLGKKSNSTNWIFQTEELQKSSTDRGHRGHRGHKCHRCHRCHFVVL